MSLNKSLAALTVVLVGAVIGFNVYSAKTNKNNKESVVVTQTNVFTSKDTSQPLSSNQKRVVPVTLNASRTLSLVGPFGMNAIQLADQISYLNSVSSEPINLIITSPGGSVLTGGALISAIQASKAEVRVICKVLCASMAAITLQYGHKRYVTDRTLLMYHPASGGAEGDIDRMYSQLGTIRAFVGRMEADVASRMGISYDYYKSLANVELWIDAHDSKNAKYVDEIVSLTVDSSDTAYVFPMETEEKLKDTFKTKEFNLLDIKW